MTEPVQFRPASERPLKVAELTRYLKYIVDSDELLKMLSVEGEIFEISRSSAGHVYFSLKDGTSQVSCALFRREAARQLDEVAGLKRGSLVVVHGSLTVYEPRGSYQIYVERVTSLGEGALAMRVEKLRAKLESEGLFSPERKRPLPAFPKKLALVTSPRSQAYHDVLHRLSTQFPFVKVVEVGASVQGEGSADELALAIDIVNRLTDVDIILLVRGGGSPEDLVSFNDERLARAVFASRIPIVSGIGHETDYTIVDSVADCRAATPSLAAAAAVPDLGFLVQRVAQQHAVLSQVMTQRLALERHRWMEANRALLLCSPQSRLRSRRQLANDLSQSAQRSILVQLRTKRARLDALRAQLKALDPLAILSRGYAVLTDTRTGDVISREAEAYPGRTLRAQVADGSFIVRVEEK